MNHLVDNPSAAEPDGIPVLAREHSADTLKTNREGQWFPRDRLGAPQSSGTLGPGRRRERLAHVDRNEVRRH